MTPAELEAAVERLVDQAVEQGFPRKITDDAALRTIATLIRPARPRQDVA